jgi:hypothetical protein
VRSPVVWDMRSRVGSRRLGAKGSVLGLWRAGPRSGALWNAEPHASRQPGDNVCVREFYVISTKVADASKQVERRAGRLGQRALMMSSTRSLASPKSIWVFSL